MRGVFRVVDVETTGLDPKVDAIVEVGVVDVLVDHWQTVHKQQPSSILCDPRRPIPPQARAIHHISDAMVAGGREPLHVARMATQDWPPFAGGALDRCLVAHNAQFDRGFLEVAMPAPVPWLCTWRLAKHLYPAAPSFGNEVLRYWLWPELEIPGDTHRACHDVDVTSRLLEAMLAKLHLQTSSSINTIADLVAFAESPVVLTGKLGFGKHFDRTWVEVYGSDSSYLHWMRREGIEAWDRDQWHTVHFLLGYATPTTEPKQLSL